MNQCNLHRPSVCRYEGPFCPMCAQEEAAKLRYAQTWGNEAQRGTDYTAGSVLGCDATRDESAPSGFPAWARIADALLAVAEDKSPAGRFQTAWENIGPVRRHAIRTVLIETAMILTDPDNDAPEWKAIAQAASEVRNA